MLKNILKLNGAQQLSKTEQKSINGGIAVGTTGPRKCLCWTNPGILNGGCTDLPKCITYTNINLCPVVGGGSLS